MNKKLIYCSLFMLFFGFLIQSLYSADFFQVKDQIIEESRFKLGFLYFTPILFLDNVGYTSSIYTYEEQDHPDWTGDFGLGIRTAAILANRLILQAEELPSYSFYLENKDLRSWSNRFSADAYTHAGPFNLKAGFRRNNLRQRPQLEFSRPYQYAAHEWSGEIDIGRRNDLFLTGYAELSVTAYDEDPYLGNYNLAEALNNTRTTFGIRLNKQIFTGTIVYADYERSSYEFDLRPERNAQAHKFSLGVEFPAMGVLQGSFHVGLKSFDPGNALFQDLQRVNGRGNIRVALMDRLRITGFYEFDTLFSYGSSDLFYDNTTFGGGMEVYLTRFLKGGASYQDSRMKYHSFIDLELQRSDRVRQQRYYLAIPFFGGTSLGFSYNVYRLTSDVLGLDYTRNFWGGFISHEF